MYSIAIITKFCLKPFGVRYKTFWWLPKNQFTKTVYDSKCVFSHRAQYQYFRPRKPLIASPLNFFFINNALKSKTQRIKLSSVKQCKNVVSKVKQKINRCPPGFAKTAFESKSTNQKKKYKNSKNLAAKIIQPFIIRNHHIFGFNCVIKNM